jgi:hypothetical protein
MRWRPGRCQQGEDEVPILVGMGRALFLRERHLVLGRAHSPGMSAEG